MLQDVVHPPEHLHLEEMSNPVSPQVFEFCDPELFSETIQNSEVTSCSNCCYEENSYANGNANLTSTNHCSNLSAVFDPQEEIDNDISASIDFSTSPSFPVPDFLPNANNQFDFSALQPQIPMIDSVVEVIPQYSNDLVPPLIGAAPLPAVFEDDCLSSVPSYFPINPSSPSCSFLGPSMADFVPGSAAFSAESSAIFALMCPDFPAQELDYHGDNCGVYCQDSMQRIFNSIDLQALSEENQHFMASNGNSASLTSDISSLKDSSYKVGKLSVEARKEKIHRYMKKRNERNFSKKIKYACRKTLADSRPRVRGRFAKNDDFGDAARASCGNHDEEDDEEVGAKEEEEMVDSSDIFAHISGVNSFKCNYSIQSWI